MKLIFIVGKKRSGKDTAVKFINDTYSTVDYKLATPIKKALEHGWNGIDYRQQDLGLPFELTPEDWDGQGIDREKLLPLSNIQVAQIMRDSLSYLSRQYGLRWPESTRPTVIDDLVLNNTEAWSIRRLMQTLGTDLVVNCFDRMFWVKLFALEYADQFNSEKEIFIVPDTRQNHELAFARAMGATVIHVVRKDTGVQKDFHITEVGLPIGPNDIVITNDSTLDEFKEKINQTLESL
ncbi:deoxynucleoside monophosphate kinase [Erwinia phage Cronus]|uniref:Deoxynucleoside monophosphate kinase n=1 Tax=Erwinia phage Cronus TaxID=2163633 RepID=A0A2S1GMI2_9CAUD|nr:deoxynucleoside monophosphate kinase [Erwinia phage Cronus]AWD90584.1 deoxynucleoside monophosphate kinase [Erwinia phage Cronus]